MCAVEGSTKYIYTYICISVRRERRQNMTQRWAVGNSLGARDKRLLSERKIHINAGARCCVVSQGQYGGSLI